MPESGTVILSAAQQTTLRSLMDRIVPLTATHWPSFGGCPTIAPSSIERSFANFTMATA